MTVKVTRVLLPTEHENQKFLVLKGEIDGIPAATKTRSINIAALADGSLVLAEEHAKLVADVEEYAARVNALPGVLAQLEVL